eukprot:scaffold184889_cov21-Prasinocladus_malaysianus.AAC.1
MDILPLAAVAGRPAAAMMHAPPGHHETIHSATCKIERQQHYMANMDSSALVSSEVIEAASR